MKLHRPYSERGKLPSFKKGLPNYGPSENGCTVAVGFPTAFIAYRFSWDSARQEGKWNFSRMVFKDHTEKPLLLLTS